MMAGAACVVDCNYFILAVIPFPFPKFQVYVAEELVPGEVLTNVTASGEQPAA